MHIVVLGSGFAGTFAARHLDRLFRRDPRVDLTLISRNNYMVFTPLLAEVAGNVVEPRHAVPPLRSFLRKAQFCQAEISGVDVQAREVQITYADQRTDRVRYDYLVVGLGSVTNYRRTPGAIDHSFDLKSLTDAIRFRNHVLLMLEQADSSDDPELRRELLTFVAAGGGYAGLEGLGLLVDFVTKALPFYPRVRREELRFILASRGKQLLEGIDERLGRYVVGRLKARGVEVRLGVTVSNVDERSAQLSPGERLPTRTVLWAAGVEVNPLVRGIGLPSSEHGALRTTPTLQVEGHPEIFALGDCAAVPSPQGGTYAPTAQNATRQAAHAAANLAALIRGRPLRPFRFRSLGSLASIGHYQAVAQIGGLPLSGLPAWLAWRAVYLAKLPSFNRKLRVSLDWLLEWLLPTDIVQLPVLPSDDLQVEALPSNEAKAVEASPNPQAALAEKQVGNP